MLEPKPGNSGTPTADDRHDRAKTRRASANTIANSRTPQITTNNGEISKYKWKPTNFHKGLPHNEFGLPDLIAFDDFVEALNREHYSDGEYATFDVALGPDNTEGAHIGDRGNSNVKTFFSTIKKDGKIVPPMVRNWESPLGGHAYDLQGPDAGDVAMAPAPKLKSSELTAEIAENFAMALLRDTPFSSLSDENASVVGQNFSVKDVLTELNGLAWFKRSGAIVPSYGATVSPLEATRREARFAEAETELTTNSAYRGSVPGAKVGPYISQFLLIGNSFTPPVSTPQSQGSYSLTKDSRQFSPASFPYLSQATASGDEDGGVSYGYIKYGVQVIDQRVSSHKAQIDHLTDWPLWLDAQNGADLRKQEAQEEGRPRFVTTPRDLSTYVHFDQLYQAYLNACLMMLEFGVPFDLGFPSGFHKTRGSFATFGGPHILSIMTEVATRALRAVRRQKFQHHLRGRPEQIAGMLTLAASANSDQLGSTDRADMQVLLEDLKVGAPNLLKWIDAHNTAQNTKRNGDHTIFPRRAEMKHENSGKVVSMPYPNEHFEPDDGKNYLLPMAFGEGSPMHAAYGAGHATVAGACTTILKAFFEMADGAYNDRAGEPKTDLSRPVDAEAITNEREKYFDPVSLNRALGLKRAYQDPADTDHSQLKPVPETVGAESLTQQMKLEGELNKLAANIAIGRNWAGVHFYTDYFDSLRMGERIAVGLLEEQMTNYPDQVTMRLKSFDDDSILISGDGKGGAEVKVLSDASGATDVTYSKWWNRHQV